MASSSPSFVQALRSTLQSLAQQPDLNFLLTNRIPRRLATRFMGWFSRIEQPQVRDLSLSAWKLFADLELEDAARSDFRSLHDVFIRELREGARPIEVDPAIVVSPCDGIVGACGRVRGVEVIQAKGFPYTLHDLLYDPALVRRYRDGCYVTLRLSSSMYHRFHAPHDCRVERVTYVSGDTWNTNPIALQRVERLFCKNERAIIEAQLTGSGHSLALVAIAAILVASIRLHFLDTVLGLQTRGPQVMTCRAELRKGQELGYFQHGSTIIVFAPQAFELCAGVRTGRVVRMGEPLLRVR
jgi:phosphatidylserine decarboxylase